MASDFLKDETENLTDGAKNQIMGKQWILRFVDLPYTLTPHLGGSEEKGTKVTEETILRLEFETNGERFNLGVVDNKQTGGNDPSNKPNVPNLWDWLASVTGIPAWVWKMLAVIIPLAIALSVLSIFFPVVRVILWSIGKGLWLIISFPYRMLGKGIKAISERRAAAKAKPKAKPAKRKTAKKPKAKRKATKKGGKK